MKLLYQEALQGPCDITHCNRHAHPSTRSPLTARPLLLLLLTLITSLAVAHVEREALWDTGDHHDRQCFK